LIGRCYRQLIAPLSGPIKDQDLRVVAPVLRLSVVTAVIEVAVAISHVLIRLGQLPHAAEEVSAREVLLGVTEIFPRHAEVLPGFTAVVVAAMVMMTMMTMMAMMAMMAMMVVVVVVVEQIIQETSDKASRKKWEHSYSPLSLGVPAPASCRRSGAC
jgi:Na+/proline symporter